VPSVVPTLQQPETCRDDTDFRYKDTKKCTPWVGSNPSKQQKRCDLDAKKGDGTFIRDYCPVTCNVCTPETTPSTPTHAPTNAPTNNKLTVKGCKNDNSYAFKNKKKHRNYCKTIIKSQKENTKKLNKLCAAEDPKNNYKPVRKFCPRFCKKKCRALNKKQK